MLIAGVIVHPSIPSQATMARGTNAYGLDARDRRFDSGCAARFFRYEVSVMNHQVKSEGTARFFHFEIMESPHIFLIKSRALIINYLCRHSQARSKPKCLKFGSCAK